jgi:hypothetical protein
MSSLQIAKAIVQTIEDHVVARLPLMADALEGDTELTLPRITPYIPGHSIAVRDAEKSEFLKIDCIGGDTLTLCTPLTASFAAGSAYVVKTYGGQTCDVHLGVAETLAHYPAITVESVGMNREPFTLESVTDTYFFDVTVWNDATTFSGTHETLLELTEATSLALHRAMFPLVAPYVQTTLSEATIPVEDRESVTPYIVVESTDGLRGTIFIEDDSGHREMNRVTAIDDTYNVVTLEFWYRGNFAAGARVIHPLVNLYDPRVLGVTYDDAQDGNKLLKASTISYSVKWHRPRDKRSVR